MPDQPADPSPPAPPPSPEAPPKAATDAEPEGPGRDPLTIFLFMMVLVIGGWFLVRKLVQMNDIQNCVMSGRKNCAPIDLDTVGK
jgi:hypothetical protein